MGIITDIILPLALAFIMFALGLGLTGKDFIRVAKQPRDFFIGAFSQIIILPIVAFILVKLWPISPELAVGVMIIASAPGGATSNILTSFQKEMLPYPFLLQLLLVFYALLLFHLLF